MTVEKFEILIIKKKKSRRGKENVNYNSFIEGRDGLLDFFIDALKIVLKINS